MNKKSITLLLLLASGASFGQVLTGCGDCNSYPSRTSYQSRPAHPQAVVHNIHASGKLNQMIRFVESMQGKVDYYTYGEVFLPIKVEIGSLKNVRAVYGASHQETAKATMAFLAMIDRNWQTIAQFKQTEMFFETINYFELILLQLKRDTYL